MVLYQIFIFRSKQDLTYKPLDKRLDPECFCLESCRAIIDFNDRHTCEIRYPVIQDCAMFGRWIPACAGMTHVLYSCHSHRQVIPECFCRESSQCINTGQIGINGVYVLAFSEKHQCSILNPIHSTNGNSRGSAFTLSSRPQAVTASTNQRDFFGCSLITSYSAKKLPSA